MSISDYSTTTKGWTDRASFSIFLMIVLKTVTHHKQSILLSLIYFNIFRVGSYFLEQAMVSLILVDCIHFKLFFLSIHISQLLTYDLYEI